MNIALCLFKFFPYGGLQRDFLNIAKELVKRGHNVRVYTQSWEGEPCPSHIELILTPTSSLTNHGKNIQYYEWVQKHLSSSPVDKVVGFNRMPNLDIYYGADSCYAEKTQNKSIFYKLTTRYRQYIHFEKGTVGRGLNNKLLVLSEGQKKSYQNFYDTEDDRFILLPPGIQKDRKYSNFPTDLREQTRKNLGLNDEDLLVISIGSDFERKGVDRSIRAIASLPSHLRGKVSFFVLGQDNSKKFIQLAQALGVGNLVHFVGGTNDVPHYIAAADLFLHPARSECAGIAILEALVGGVPEIVTDVCGYAPYVSKAQSGKLLSSPFSQEQFNAVLLEALNPSSLRCWRQNACYFADREDLYSLHQKAADVIVG